MSPACDGILQLFSLENAFASTPPSISVDDKTYQVMSKSVKWCALYIHLQLVDMVLWKVAEFQVSMAAADSSGWCKHVHHQLEQRRLPCSVLTDLKNTPNNGPSFWSIHSAIARHGKNPEKEQDGHCATAQWLSLKCIPISEFYFYSSRCFYFKSALGTHYCMIVVHYTILYRYISWGRACSTPYNFRVFESAQVATPRLFPNSKCCGGTLLRPIRYT